MPALLILYLSSHCVLELELQSNAVLPFLLLQVLADCFAQSPIVIMLGALPGSAKTLTVSELSR